MSVMNLDVHYKNSCNTFYYFDIYSLCQWNWTFKSWVSFDLFMNALNLHGHIHNIKVCIVSVGRKDHHSSTVISSFVVCIIHKCMITNFIIVCTDKFVKWRRKTKCWLNIVISICLFYCVVLFGVFFWWMFFIDIKYFCVCFMSNLWNSEMLQFQKEVFDRSPVY